MRNLKRALAALFVLLLAAVVLFFVLENQQAVSLVMFGWTAPPLPVAVLVLVRRWHWIIGKTNLQWLVARLKALSWVCQFVPCKTLVACR